MMCENIFFIKFSFYIVIKSVKDIDIMANSVNPDLASPSVCLSFGFGLGWCLTSQSTAMVMSGRSVHLTTLFSWASFI